VSVVVASDRCRLDDLFVGVGIDSAARATLWCGAGWTKLWSAEFRLSAELVEMPVAAIDGVDPSGLGPVRAFSWGTKQRHRPGLQFMVSTGRHHGFESLEEQKLLLAVDFAGAARVVVSQPLRLRFETGGARRSHIPDFLVADGTGVWVFDVRPAGRIGEPDRVAFAAMAEAALAAGWGYRVVGDWRRQVVTGLDALSAQRRDLADPLGIQRDLVRTASSGPCRFGDLVGSGPLAGVWRAHALHLLWWRRLGVDLAGPLGDDSLVWVAGGQVG
jgi:hypothetical protein